MVDFNSTSTSDLKKFIGLVMTELRARAKVARDAAAGAVASVVIPADKQERAAKREQAKQEYKDKKAAYASRALGIKRVSDGKVLKRRFDNHILAAEQADALCLSMKAPSGYIVVELSA
jgi:hypothetical protein